MKRYTIEEMLQTVKAARAAADDLHATHGSAAARNAIHALADSVEAH